MLSFKDFLKEQVEQLDEALITFGGKAYPKFGQIVIMAGGAGSGKGFVKDKLVGLEGKVFDVDELKTLASKTPVIRKRVKEKFGVDLADLAANLKNPDNVRMLHEIIGDAMNLPDKRMQAFYASVLTAADDRKPNVIFDVTLKNMKKLNELSKDVSDIGYDKKNIHIVWVVNDIEVAIDQNAKRARTVPVKILTQTHEGASATMKEILQMGTDLGRYMDGEIVLAFNKVGVDSDLRKSDKGGSYVEKANYVYVKRSGKPVNKAKVSKDIQNKLKSYVPDNVDWTDF